MVGQQDHDQAQGGAVRAVEQAQQVARTGGGAGGVGVHAVGGRILQAASSVGCAVEGFSDPRGYFTWWDLTAGFEQNL
jgi:hypothetical protein